jgi:hypothetical protein
LAYQLSSFTYFYIFFAIRYIILMDHLYIKYTYQYIIDMSTHRALYVKNAVNVGNIRAAGNTISSIDINGDINLTPNGTGNVLLNTDPKVPLAAATKQYVDASVAGLTFKSPARVTTVSTLPSYNQSGSGVGATLTASANGSINNVGIDSITSLILNDRVLVKSEGSTSDLHNGVYDLTQVGSGSNPWILTRSIDFDQDTEVVSGTYILITDGTINTDISYVVSTSDPITIDGSGIEFVRFAPVTGENNTASNIGSTGVGIFKQKIDEDLEFKKINTGSVHITIDDDTVNNEVDIGFDQAQITGTGVINSGSISSGFGNIDVGVSTIDGGATTVTVLNVDNIQINANTISSTDANGDINLIPNGAGGVILKADPIGVLGAATKQYVDAVATGLDVKTAVRVTTNVALPPYTQLGSGVGATLTASTNGSINNVGIDSVTSLILNDRVLVRSIGATSDIHNGIYDLTHVGDGSNPWVLTRSTDFDQTDDVATGAYVLVTDGIIFTGSAWTVSTAGIITVDTNNINFSQFATPTPATTASNIGTGGIGVFKQKSGNDLEFRNIDSTTPHVGVSLDAGDSVNLTFDQTQITGTGAVNSGSITSGFGNVDIGASSIDTTGALSAGSVVVDGISIDNSAITLSGSTGANIINVPFNLSDALTIKDGTLSYIQITSTIAAQNIKLLQNTNVTGTLTTTGNVNGRDMTADGIYLDLVALTGIEDLDAIEVNQLENINTVTISNTQWGYLGSSDQAIATTNSVQYVNMSLTGYTDLTDISAPTHPGVGVGRLYKKTGNDGVFWKPDSAGVEIDLTTAPQYIRTGITDTESPYTVLPTEEIIGVDSSSGVVAITLPLISGIGGTNNYRKYYVVDEGGSSSINNITISTSGSDTINKNMDDLCIDIDHSAYTFYNDGTSNWIIL